MKKKTLSRRFDFEIKFYEELMADAIENNRSFPMHIMWILKKYLTEVEKQ